ncbi:MAG: sigma-70 family RNA polymerase sigma factor [Firmicutes bacterium]|nr:sigma-70 family RNA polymerase sigma factor [Bacillota bacterium]
MKLPFEQFYEQYYPVAVGHVKKKIQSREDAEDLVMNAFVYCYEHYDTYDPEKAPMGAWLFLIINSRIKNYYRDRKELVLLEEGSPFDVQDSSADQKAIELKDMRKDLARALQSLPEMQQKMVILKYFYNYSSEQLGQEFGLKPNHVRTMLSRILDKLEKNEAIVHWRTELD